MQIVCACRALDIALIVEDSRTDAYASKQEIITVKRQGIYNTVKAFFCIFKIFLSENIHSDSPCDCAREQ